MHPASLSRVRGGHLFFCVSSDHRADQADRHCKLHFCKTHRCLSRAAFRQRIGAPWRLCARGCTRWHNFPGFITLNGLHNFPGFRTGNGSHSQDFRTEILLLSRDIIIYQFWGISFWNYENRKRASQLSRFWNQSVKINWFLETAGEN